VRIGIARLGIATSFLLILALSLAGSLQLIYLSATANAHATLLGSTPENGETLESFPKSIQLRFNEPLLDIQGTTKAGSLQIELTSKELGPLASEAEISGQNVFIKTLPTENMEIEGEILLTYRVVSQDGHVIKGEIGFLISKTASLSPTLTQDTSAKNNEGVSIYLLIALIIIAFAVAIALLLQPSRELNPISEQNSDG
jgi:copper transport protein